LFVILFDGSLIAVILHLLFLIYRSVIYLISL